MADFQTASAAIGLARDVADLVQYLRMVKAAMDSVEDDLDGLIKELETLRSSYGQLEEKFTHQPHQGTLNEQLEELWSELRKTLQEGRSTFDKVDSEVRSVYGDEPKTQGLIDAFRKQNKLRKKYPKIAELRTQIQTYNGVLQITLIRISLANQDSSRDFERITSSQLQELQDGVDIINEQLSKQSTEERNSAASVHEATIAALNRVSASLQSTEPADINKEFDIPQPVDPNYVGREDKARILSKGFFSRTQGQPQEQKRFVVYGVGGSGKTQFCCKFAQDNQQRFWGVFWIDGRSVEQLRQTLARNVAKVGGVDENYKAALSWLARQHERWLLIVDNADDAKIDLMDYLPKGGRGHVLITTRNPGFQTLGNVGPRYFKFGGLDKDEANALLFRSAGLSTSSAEEKSWAEKIVDALGYLALAISVAGNAISQGYCKLHEYIQYFEDMWQKRRQAKRRADKAEAKNFAKNRFVSGNSSEELSSRKRSRQDRVEVTFDISYTAIKNKVKDSQDPQEAQESREARDALDLLKTFAFLHCENVYFRFLESCIENTVREKKQQEADKEAAAKSKASSPPKTWKQWIADLCMQVLRAMYSVRGPDVLPQLLREAKEAKKLDRWRVNGAMGQLTRYSLVTYNSKTDSWSMHPLVHKWAREMIETKVGEQYLYCEAATTLLCDCIYLQQVDEELLRQLLPHVDQVRKAQAKLAKRIVDNRMARMKPWPVFESGFSAQRALTMAKFSIVYMQNSRWEDAEALQTTVQHFTLQVLGYKDEKTRRITKLLAQTLYYLGRSDDSAVLLEQLLDACKEYCGPEAHETLLTMHQLGESRFQQGRVAAAKSLFEDALEGLRKLKGPEDDDTLTAMDSLGNAMRLFATDDALRESKRYHEKTVEVRTRLHGADDLKTVTSREFLYSAATWSGTLDELFEADKGLAQVIEIRKSKLGREHGFTLLATLNQARVKVVLEQFDEADKLFSECLPIAERNHGPDHLAILFARFCLGRLRCRQHRWVEAREILVDVTERQKTALQGWGRDHFDRLGGLLELVHVHDALEEHDERDEVAEEALRIFKKVTSGKHPWEIRLRANSDEWKRKRQQNASEKIESDAMATPARDGPLSMEEGLFELPAGIGAG